MTIQVPTSWPTISDREEPFGRRQKPRSVHMDGLVRASHLVRSVLRAPVSLSETQTTTSGTFANLVHDAPMTKSPTTSDVYEIALYGSKVDVRVTLDDGTTSVSATVARSSSSLGVSTGSIDVSTLTASDDMVCTVEFRLNGSGTGTLSGLLLEERIMTATDLE